MSSSTDVGLLVPLATPELRSGEWTRLGPSGLLGDAVTESALAGLAVEARAAASAQGYAVGWAQGRREAAESAGLEAAQVAEHTALTEARRAQEHAAALTALAEAAAELRAAATAAAARVEEQAAGLALELLTELVGHEVRSTTTTDILARVAGLLPDLAGSSLATVRVHPAHVDGVRTGLDGVRVVADAGLGTADAVIETDLGVLDLQVDAALERIREVLA